MDIQTLLQQNRSYRRFDPSVSISKEELMKLVELTRYAASAANQQSLRYILVADEERNNKIFPLTAWAGYLKNWPGPAEGERPVAYIIMCKETASANTHILFDAGIAAQNILLGAVEKGLGGCIIGAFNKPKLRVLLDLPDRYEILYVIALGKPAEEVVIEELADNNIKYWRDEHSVHHVPKRKLNDLILEI
ncbi:nitroreductase family protein [Parabacteroides pacaensis]|uniref:nitroreductase family protein n=1 Tax=Parabacteroides pacaensis TaxID=2086575 RepID=UPI000D0EBE0F|nr:nitroreductase family protein [Parabacteroides pacaensis]